MISHLIDFGLGRLRRGGDDGGGFKMISGENLVTVLVNSGRSSVKEVAREPVGEVDCLNGEEMVERGYESVSEDVDLGEVSRWIVHSMASRPSSQVVVIYDPNKDKANVYVLGEDPRRSGE